MQIKFLALVAILALASQTAFAQYKYVDGNPVYGRTSQNTYTIGGAAFVDTDSALGTDIQLSLSFGYYIENGLMVGGYGSFWDNKWYNTSSVGGTGKWHFWDFGFDGQSMPCTVYLGADLGLGYVKTGVDSATALVFGARIGFDLFFTDNISVGIALDAHVATDDIYPVNKDKGLANTDFSLKYGVTYYW